MAFLVKSCSLKNVLLGRILTTSLHSNPQSISDCIKVVFRCFASGFIKTKPKKKPRRKNEHSIETMAVVAEAMDTCPTFEKKPCFDYWDNLSAVLYQAEDLRLEQTHLPAFDEHEVLIATECVGLSQSEFSFISRGKFKNFVLDEPIILGHEASGTVVEVGRQVSKFRPGDRVAIEPTIPCRTCDLCKKGRFNLCPNIYMCGMPPSHGTLARFFAWPEDFCLKLPHHVGFDEAALVEPLAIAHHTCKRGGITVGSKVVIIGAGPIGLLNMLCARAYGATRIVVTDIRKDRLRCANSMGANAIILIRKNTIESELVQEIIEALDGPAHVCLECSGSPPAVQVASEVTMPGGTIVLVELGPVDTAIRTTCTAKEIDIRGVRNYCDNYQSALDLLAAGRLNFRKMITHDYKLNDIKEALSIAKSGRAIKILIHTNPKWIPVARTNYS